MWSPLRKRGEKLNHRVREHWEEGNMRTCGLPWSLGLSYTICTTRHAIHKHTSDLVAWQERPWGFLAFTPQPAIATTPKDSCWVKAALAQPFKGESGTRIPICFKRTRLPCIVSLCQMTAVQRVVWYSVHYKMRFPSQKNNIRDNWYLELK